MFENGVKVSFEESTLGEYNWMHANKSKQSIQSGSEDDMTDAVEAIIQDFGIEDQYLKIYIHMW